MLVRDHLRELRQRGAIVQKTSQVLNRFAVIGCLAGEEDEFGAECAAQVF